MDGSKCFMTNYIVVGCIRKTLGFFILETEKDSGSFEGKRLNFPPPLALITYSEMLAVITCLWKLNLVLFKRSKSI